MSSILVVCAANVCRSVYTGGLLEAALAHSDVEVHSAGLNAIAGNAPCPDVVRRLEATSTTSPIGARPVSVDQLRSADLVIVMTTNQRVAVARLCPQAQRRTMTLVEAATLAAAADRQVEGTDNLTEYVERLDLLRSRVPMPTERARQRFLGIFPGRSRPRPAISIEDAHATAGKRHHRRTLDRVEEATEDLIGHLRGQPWLTAAPGGGTQP